MNGRASMMLLDACGLDAERIRRQVLEALVLLPRDARLHMVVDQEPRSLYRELDRRGFTYSVEYLPDLLIEVTVWQRM